MDSRSEPDVRNSAESPHRPRAAVPPGARSRRFSRTYLLVAWRIARTLLIAYLLVVLILMALEDWLIFFPARFPEGDWHPEGLTIEDAWFAAADGTRLHGWYVACPAARGVVLFCHGNAGNITHREEILRRLHHVSRVTVLLFDYRGYGRSEGKPSERGILQDARAARTWLAHRENLPEERLILMGESLGGAVAVHLAAEKPARALILESTFTSLPDVAQYHYPFFPVRLLMRTRLDALAKISEYHGPLFQCHGDADTIVPYRLGRRLFDAANEPKRFLTFPGGDHNDLRDLEYYEQLGRFIEELE